jgi:hypothetical protein
MSMYNSRRRSEAALRATERRKREDDAPRLKEEVPRLEELRLEIEEFLGDSTVSAARHSRLIVVDRAPALFEFPCTEPSCNDGGHDLTHAILRALRTEATEFRGEDSCYGRLGTSASPCRRVLRYLAHAKYGE